MTISPEPLFYPQSEAPANGDVVEIARGVLWVRFALPFQLNHINIFLIEDGDGWAVVDAGINNAATKAAWDALVAGPLKGRRLTRLIVTHFHPDHIGLAGWLCERFDMPMWTTQTSYLSTANISLQPGALDAKPYRDFYLRHGLEEGTTNLVATQGHGYLRMVAPLPPTFQRIVAGDHIMIGGRRFDVLTGDGHAPEQAMLYCPEDRLFFAADQVLAKISPNVSVWAVDPDGDPLGLYLRSLMGLRRDVPEDVLVLPGHQLPFHGLHRRAHALADHHAERCALISEATRKQPMSAAELVPVLFHRPLDPHQMSFAFSEVLAHVNYMLGQNDLVWSDDTDMRRVTAR
jgi:glyoxylase-like metal-dependent hydrolase (beta-lactamase superfamily II)